MPPASPWRLLLTGRMAVALFMGFSCGLPLLITSSLLQAWMKDAGLSLATIGLSSLLGLPYALKFLWAPLLDRYTPPFLGRRRGWLFPTQLLLAIAIADMGLADPTTPELLGLLALAVSFLSATQDIAVDAYRRESLTDDELGLGSSLYVYGYRTGMLLASGGGLILADRIPFSQVYFLLSLGMSVGLATTLLAREPQVDAPPPRTFPQAVWLPLLSYFQRPGAWTILAFILLYKLGDTLASSLSTPFYLDLGYSKSDIGMVVKLFGFWATMAGILMGGMLQLRWGYFKSLLYFGILQALSTGGFVVLSLSVPTLPLLAAVIACENLTGGLGTAAFVGYMGSLTDKRFTATQYALLSSLMGVPRILATAPAGYLAAQVDWPGFYAFCVVAALPGLLLLRVTRSPQC